MVRWTALFVIGLLACLGCATSPAKSPASTTVATPVKEEIAAPIKTEVRNPVSTIETPKGKIVIELYNDKAPQTVANFVKLAKQGFYNNIIFHRIIPGFMIQTGDPTGTGRSGPGYTFADEFGSGLKHDSPGILSMANSGPNTNGSQFFITLAPTPWLDGKHAIFGKVVQGQEVVEAIVSVPRDQNDRPREEIKMLSISIQE